MEPKARAPAAPEAASTLLEEMLPELGATGQATHAPSRSSAPRVGECTDATHPTLVGRVKVRIAMVDGTVDERWLPALHGLSVRKGDRVLVVQPDNWPEAVVTGVVDGFAARPEVPREPAAALTLLPDETLRVMASDGRGLLEVHATDAGPVLHLLEKDLDIELPGKLRVRAEAIELAARQGTVKIAATDDVQVEGEVIHLN